MALLNTATKVYAGANVAKAVYRGSTKVWPATGGPPPFLPTSIPNISGWWDASDLASITIAAGTSVSQWSDKSGKAVHLTQATTTRQPDSGVTFQNGLSTVTFNGTSQILASTIPTQMVDATSGAWTIVCIMGPKSISGTKTGVDQDSAASPTRLFEIRHSNDIVQALAFNTASSAFITSSAAGTATIGAGKVYSAVRGATSVQLWVDGVTTGPTTTTGTPAITNQYPFSLGGSRGASGGAQYWFGSIAEVVVYSRALTTAERQQLETYMGTKWGVGGVAPPAGPSYFTGGIQTSVGGYRYHTFNTSGTLTFVPGDGAVAVPVEYLVVGGGGGGACRRAGGGGGAGGYVASSAALSATQAITVGVGGVGGDGGTDVPGGDGSASSLDAISAAGGGGGGFPPSAAGTGNGRPGGSGGGGANMTPAANLAAGGTGVAGQGFKGGDGTVLATSNPGQVGAGGGGAGGPGGDATGTPTLGNAGAGGNGLQWLDGVYRGGGGGGQQRGTTGSPASGAGGLGGGGDGSPRMPPIPGAPNTGGGGGGMQSTTAGEKGGAGGSGVVIVRYPEIAGMP